MHLFPDGPVKGGITRMDSGDKAANKAMSMAYKTAMLQTLAIPVSGEPDADAESHDLLLRSG